MNLSVTSKPTMFGFLFLRSHLRFDLNLSDDAAYFFEELRESPSPSYFIFEAFGPDFCSHTEMYISASLELASHGVLINTYISNN